MLHDYYDIEINGRFHPVPKHGIEGEPGFSITIWDSNVEAARLVIAKYQVKHIHISASNLDFLSKPEFATIEGIQLSGAIEDIGHLEQLEHLKSLSLSNNRKGKLDFQNLINLEYLYCDYSNNYRNLDALVNLKTLHLIRYPEIDLQEFTALSKLEILHIQSAKCKTLKGIEALQMLQKITLDECKKLGSLSGVEQIRSIEKLEIIDCRNLNDHSSLGQLSEDYIVLIDGQTVRETTVFPEDKIETLVNNLKELETDGELIELIKEQLSSLTDCNEKNWKNKLLRCVDNLNELSLKFDGIYTEEREEIISTIEDLLVDFNDDEVAGILDGGRIW